MKIDILKKYISTDCMIICDKSRMDEGIEIFKYFGSSLLINYIPYKISQDVLVLGDYNLAKSKHRTLFLLPDWWKYYEDIKEPKALSVLQNGKRMVITNPSGTKISFGIEGTKVYFDGKNVHTIPFGRIVIPIRKSTLEGQLVIDHSNIAKPKTEVIFEHGRISRISGDMRLSAFIRHGDRKVPFALSIGLNKKARLIEKEEVAKLTNGVLFLEFHDWFAGIFEANAYVDGELIISEGKFLV